MSDLETNNVLTLPTLTSIQSIDSYDDISDENLSPDERNEKEKYYKSIFTKVGNYTFN